MQTKHNQSNEHASDPLQLEITKQEKANRICQNFDQISKNYDRFNNIASFGLHHLWKRKMLSLSKLTNSSPHRILDVCCGTGDLALLLARKLKNKPNLKIEAVDFSAKMLSILKRKIQNSAHLNLAPIIVIHQPIELLKRPPESYDALFIAFGLRNLTHIPQALSTFYTFLKPGGKLIILDFNQKLRFPLLDKIYSSYFNFIVPKIGFFLEKKKHIMYNYLPKSVACYLSSKEISTLLKQVGFVQVDYRPLFLGQTGIHVALK